MFYICKFSNKFVLNLATSVFSYRTSIQKDRSSTWHNYLDNSDWVGGLKKQ